MATQQWVNNGLPRTQRCLGCFLSLEGGGGCWCNKNALCGAREAAGSQGFAFLYTALLGQSLNTIRFTSFQTHT